MLKIRTEERPKTTTLKEIINIYLKNIRKSNLKLVDADTLVIKPIFIGNNFSFKYIIILFRDDILNELQQDNIPLDLVSGTSSFIDFLLFEDNKLVALIEETKTDDSESRNTGVYQRASKFVYANILFPLIPKFMLYTNQSNISSKPSNTAIFGTKLLKTIGVSIIGKNSYYDNSTPFLSIKEICAFKDKMRRPPLSNVPVLITKDCSWDPNIQCIPNSLFISGTLSKPLSEGNIAHDPNIGCLTLIGSAVRKLDPTIPIYITHHGVSQKYIVNNTENKFLYISNFLNMKLCGLAQPNIKYDYNQLRELYYKSTVNSEKVTTIFLHLLLEHSKKGKLIYENHAGCERGYFYNINDLPEALPKSISDKKLYIPDLIMILESGLVINIEGKKLSTLISGLQDLENYDLIESVFITPNYGSNIQRWVSTFGGSIDTIPHPKVILHINNDGSIIINEQAPLELKSAIDFFKY